MSEITPSTAPLPQGGGRGARGDLQCTGPAAAFPDRRPPSVLPGSPARPLARRLCPVLLAALVLIVFLPALRNGFVWDDQQYLLDNPHVTGGFNAANLRWALTALDAGNWHPLAWASHQLDVQIFGLDPWGHHLTSVLIHLASTLLLFRILQALTGAAGRSLLVAALFAVHPLHVESVAWIAERKDVLSALLGLFATGAHLRFVREPTPLRYGAVLLLFAAGLAAKPMLVTLPFVLLLLDAWPLGRLTLTRWRRPLVEKIPLLGLSAVVSIVTFQAQVGAGAYHPYPLGARVSNAVVASVRYLGKTVAPFDLAAFYPHAETALPLDLTLGALLTLCLATALAVAQRRRRPWLALGWFWFCGMLVPVIGLVQVGQQSMADRYVYLPLVGLFIAAAWSLGELAARRPAWLPALVALPVLHLALLSEASRVQIGHWRDTVSLYTRALDVSPGNWLAHFNLGVYYDQRGQEALAADHYREALRTRPAYEQALNNLGAIAADHGRSEEAVGYFRAALAARPDHPEALVNLGTELLKLGRSAEAEPFLVAGLRRNPASFEALLGLAEVLASSKRWAEAASRFENALRLRPDAIPAHRGLGIALAGQGRHREAAAQFESILLLDPADTEARIQLGIARARLNR